MTTRVAVDIGGTFTDVVVFDDVSQRLSIGKTLSTPKDLLLGISTGLRSTAVSMSDVDLLIHGSTVVINALIERSGARTALITTAGFRDVYEIGRVNRPDAFNLNFTKHRPLISRDQVFEVPERLRADGSVQADFDVAAARTVAQQVRQQGYEAVAVVFLHAYRDPRHELRMGQILAEECPGTFVTLSHELTREYREFERTSTTVANAFVGPLVSEYLRRLEGQVDDADHRTQVAIMQSNGGLSDLVLARRQPVQMMESGPAGGVVGTIEVCRSLGLRDAIAFDMGGTTAKASVIRDLVFPQAAEYFVGGYHTGLPIRVPCLDIVEVGTGGGSIAWLDEADGLHVGPRSAGAQPGPACYGQGGTELTVTDAAVVLGHLPSHGRLSGNLLLNGDASREVTDRVAARVGLDAASTAAGVLAIAASSMANAVRAVTTERGLDPRQFTLFAYGGNGPLHISLVARELGISTVIVPPAPAVFAALGMLLADLRRDVVLTDIRPLADETLDTLTEAFADIEGRCERELVAGAVPFADVSFLRSADMRYHGQEHSLTVAMPDLATAAGIDTVKGAFDVAHQQRFGHSAAGEPAEIVSLRVSAIGRLPRPELAKIAPGDDEPAAARSDTRSLIFEATEPARAVDVYERVKLLAGNVITGPALIDEGTTTTLLRPGDRAEVDLFGNLVLTIGSPR